ncbi:MAG: TauD/TfdA family dioxygenase [Actinomycetota bacterium]
MTSAAVGERVLVVSIDGLAPRWIGPARTPNLCALAQSGAATFTAQTVDPPVTLPAHASMLRGVAPDVHGVRNNTPIPMDDVAPSFLQVARDAGHPTLAIATWGPLDSLFEPRSATFRSMFDGGYDAATEDPMTMAGFRAAWATAPWVAFVYLEAPDLVGHDHGWDSPEYGAAVGGIDRQLGELLEIVGSTTAVVVTTDHGGTGRDHQMLVPDVLDTFVVLRSTRVAPGGMVGPASIVDIAPTVADLAGLAPHAEWTGSSLLGGISPVVDVLIDLLDSTAQHSYGENVDMLSHALQTAACARADGRSEDLVLAALLHDIGHVLGEATRWGIPEHATMGARYLRPWLPASIIDPIAGHVDAKRALVVLEDDYAAGLSDASVATLEQQGGPFDDDELAAFLATPGADAAMALRRADDSGKIEGLAVDDLEAYRPTLRAALRRTPSSGVGAAWARDSCDCSQCVDPDNGQRLITPDDLRGWVVAAEWNDGGLRVVDLVRDDGSTHRCFVPPPEKDADARQRLTIQRFDRGGLSRFLSSLATRGAAIMTDVATEPGEVLRFAAEIGFVRTTNYGDLFDVVADPAPINLAYTPRGLPLHTDNPYREPVPTVQLLHCLRSAAEGGASRFADGFAVADELRAFDPAAFDALASTPVSFRFRAPDVDLRARVPIISVEPDGRVSRITVNNRSMRSLPPGPDTDRWYDAYLRFTRMLEDAALEVTLAPGELIAFDNRRVLHGRAAFAGDSDRHLQGCYIDIDAVRSRVAAQASRR